MNNVKNLKCFDGSIHQDEALLDLNLYWDTLDMLDNSEIEDVDSEMSDFSPVWSEYYDMIISTQNTV